MHVLGLYATLRARFVGHVAGCGVPLPSTSRTFRPRGAGHAAARAFSLALQIEIELRVGILDQ